jgi:Protein of unknown function (DUF1097)
MPKLAALTVSVGVLAVVATWLFSLSFATALNLQVWQAFIAWGCHFHCGGKFPGYRNATVCMIFGALVGMVAVMLAGQLGSLGQFAAPVAVGLGAAVICMASALPPLAAIPASVYGFAAIAGLILVGKVAPAQAILPTAISIVIGALFGIVSEYLAGALAKKDAPAAAGAAA